VIVDQGTGVEHFRSKLNKRVVRLGGGILLSPTQMDYREVFDPWPGKQNEDWATDVFDDSRFESDHRSKFVHNTELLNFQPLGRHPISDEYLKLLPPRLFGYSLLDHKWLALDITRVCELPPRSLAANFRDLVLPDGHAMLLQALIKDHIQLPKQGAEKSNEIADGFGMDVVAGKGKGLIILLHGVPGVGKTSTAECLAAELKRPLLPITCGDIGTTAKEAEETLSSFCELAHRWRCVLLLDEADVFLAKREKGDIHRNSLVSGKFCRHARLERSISLTVVLVFLRVLEYYSGVIILTTNRVGEFDEAFRSRIHISLYYPKLDELSTKEIWEKNLSRLKSSGLDIDIEEAKIRRFVDWHWEQNRHRPTRRWNGRQIKNAFQTALALAKWDFDDPRTRGELKRPLLRAKHFKRVSETSAHFDDYIRDVHGIQEEDDAYGILAGRDELRQDSNPGFFKPGPQEISRPGKRLPVRRGTNSYGAAAAQSRAYEFDDDDVSEEDADDVQRLELELKLAKLKKKKTPKAPAARSVVDEDDESW
jgi:SpoVK/Ycf46/Vps4 family AAA+-type ATPase